MPTCLKFPMVPIALFLVSCAHDWTKSVEVSPKATFEGTVTFGAPFFDFVSNPPAERMGIRGLESSAIKIHAYLRTQPDHRDSSSDSGTAISAHIKFMGRVTTQYDELNQRKATKLVSISEIIELGPVTPDYLKSLQ